MFKHTWVIALLLFGWINSIGWADKTAPPGPAEYSSLEGAFVFRVEPDPDAGPGHCMGKLYRSSGNKRELVWSRYLINNDAPLRVVVSDSGRRVVTIDEWGAPGQLPIVIYKEGGRLLTVHNLESLGLFSTELLNRVRISKSGYWWAQDALFFFSPDEGALIVRLHWERLLVIDLGTGRMLGDNGPGGRRLSHDKKQRLKALLDYANAEVPKVALRQLDGTEYVDVLAAIRLSKELRLEKAVPRLSTLASTPPTMTVRGLTAAPEARMKYMQEMALDALKDLMGEDDRLLMGNRGVDPVIETLMAYLEHSDPTVRANAAVNLGKIGGQRALDKLIAMAREDEAPVARAAASQAICKIEHPAAKAGEVAWGEEVDGLQLGVRCTTGDRPYRIGEVIEFDVYVRNLTKHTIRSQTASGFNWTAMIRGQHIIELGEDDNDFGTPIALVIPPYYHVSGSVVPGRLHYPVRHMAYTLRPANYDPGKRDSCPSIRITPGQYEMSSTSVFCRINDEVEDPWTGALTSGTLKLEVIGD